MQEIGAKLFDALTNNPDVAWACDRSLRQLEILPLLSQWKYFDVGLNDVRVHTIYVKVLTTESNQYFGATH